MADLIRPTDVDVRSLRTASAQAVSMSRRRDGTIGSDAELEVELRRLLRLVEKANGPLTQEIDFTPLTRISSEDWNRLQDSLWVDLRAIYELLGAIESTNRQIDTTSQSDLLAAKAAIRKALNQLRVYRFLREYPEYQDLKVIDFTRAVNETQKTPRAVVDGQIRMLELPIRFRDTASSARRDARSAHVTTQHFGGGIAGGFGDEVDPRSILDPNSRTFWAEMISSKGPIKVQHKTSWGLYEADGVVGEVTVTFSHAVRVNNLKLLPFTEFPYSIVDLAYREALTGDWLTLPGFEIHEQADDWVEFDFTHIAMTQFRVTIEQQNYTRSVYLIPRSVVHKGALWSQILTSVFNRDIHEVDLTTPEEGDSLVEPELLRYFSAMEMVDSDSNMVEIRGERETVTRDLRNLAEGAAKIADQIVPGSPDSARESLGGPPLEVEDEAVQITRYEYMYGIRTLEVSGVIYEPFAHYESPRFDTNGTVLSCEIETAERHVEFTDGLGTYRKTSIEYEVEVAPDVRFPIVPLTDIDGENYVVKDEYLPLKNGVGTLRFTPAAESIRVRENGTRVAASRLSTNGRVVTVESALAHAIYTATYYVSVAATELDFETLLNSTRLLGPEEYSSTDQDNAIRLNYYPYVVYEVVRDYDLWTQPDPDVARWEWTPEFFPVSHGTIALTNGSTAVTLTKADSSDPDFGDLIDEAQYEIQIYVPSTGETLPVASIGSTTGAALEGPYEGASASGLRYVIGRTKTYDGRVWGLNTQLYEPVVVLVDGVKADNITNYATFEHPAFTPGSSGVSYIHAGRVLYFSEPLKGRKLQIWYSWNLQYLKLVATLRSNLPVSTVLTPKIDRAHVRIKSTPL